MYSRLKIFGHPIHPMVIAYPIAFYTMTLVAFIIYGVTHHLVWLNLAIAVNVAGVGMAVVAALPGFIDWAFGIPSGTDAKRTGLAHMSLNVLALALFAVNLAIHAAHWNGPPVGAGVGIVLAAIGVACTVGAGFFGWSLVQDHHVGVHLTREQEMAESNVGRAG